MCINNSDEISLDRCVVFSFSPPGSTGTVEIFSRNGGTKCEFPGDNLKARAFDFPRIDSRWLRNHLHDRRGTEEDRDEMIHCSVYRLKRHDWAARVSRH